MESGLPRFRPGFTCPALLRYKLALTLISSTGLSPCVVSLSREFNYDIRCVIACPTTPQVNLWFRLFPLRSPLLRESLLISSPPLTEMSHFSGSRSASLCIQLRSDKATPYRVSPFGNPRFKASFQLPEAYRRYARPSSPSNAKASTSSP